MTETLQEMVYRSVIVARGYVVIYSLGGDPRAKHVSAGNPAEAIRKFLDSERSVSAEDVQDVYPVRGGAL